MKNTHHTKAKLISLLTLLVIITGVFVIAFTFAGSPEAPDAIATYTRNRLTWSGVSMNGDTADLNIFGEPEQGETLPLIHPYSGDTYYLRLKNDVWGKITYSVYLYTDTISEIPLEFEAIGEDTTNVTIPADLIEKQIVSAFTGTVDGNNMKNFEIKWQWKTDSDEADTLLGDRAVGEDLIYTLNILVVIEDNNFYDDGSTDGYGGGTIYTLKSDSARILHRKYITGYPDGTFKPNGYMSRAEVCAIFARILSDFNEDNLTETTSSFTDAKISQWHNKYIASLEKSGIINGYGDGTFKPDNFITRAEFAAMCVKLYESRNKTIKGDGLYFSDVADNHWGKYYISKAARQGFIEGYPDGTYRPDNYITRAEVVTVVNRMLSRYADKQYINDDQSTLVTFTDVTDNGYWAYYDILEASNEHYTKVSGKTESWFSVTKNK